MQIKLFYRRGDARNWKLVQYWSFSGWILIHEHHEFYVSIYSGVSREGRGLTLSSFRKGLYTIPAVIIWHFKFFFRGVKRVPQIEIFAGGASYLRKHQALFIFYPPPPIKKFSVCPCLHNIKLASNLNPYWSKFRSTRFVRLHLNIENIISM